MNKLKALLIAVSIALPAFAQTDNLPMAEGKFKPTDESLKQYQYPEWFRDAKFGIWAHWGPPAVPRGGGGWYGCEMYQGATYNCATKKHKKAHPDYIYHVEHYGHPSKFGFKDIIPLWKAEKWNPEELMKLYKRVGAKYFVALAIHHDNFSLWDTKLNRWNSLTMGPQKDVVGIWQQAAQKEGLYFGVSEHLAASYNWFQKAHKSDPLGDKAEIPYDGANPEYWDLYHEPSQPGDGGWLTNNPKRQRDWFDRIQELIDKYRPDLLYSDSQLPFENVGRSLVAHYYNSALEEIATWIADNGDAIYGTRPWKVYGEGTSVTAQQEKGEFDGVKDVHAYKQGDLRFTMKGKTLYAFSMEKPEGDIHISSLGLKTATGQKIKSVSMLGSNEKISWTQNDDEVVIQKPNQLPEYKTVVFEIH